VKPDVVEIDIISYELEDGAVPQTLMGDAIFRDLHTTVSGRGDRTSEKATKLSLKLRKR